MIAVDAVQAVVSLVPVVVLDVVVGASNEGPGRWPLVAVAVGGVFGAAADAYRWLVTRYRITDDLVELRTGLMVRRERSVRRDRIRSVDVHARLRHRLGGLRIVSVGAGQQESTGEAAFDLDAVSISDAERLRQILLEGRSASVPPASVGPGTAPQDDRPFEEVPLDELPQEQVDVIARFDPRWVVFNVVGSWAYLMAGGLIWGGYWLLSSLGIDVAGIVQRSVDWERIGPVGTVAVAFAAMTLVGAVGLAVNFFVEYGRFVLARVPTDAGGTALRTSHGLLTTREVTRDDDRLRGVQISEPVLWRWMGTADTSVITTGLSLSAMSQPAAVLPHGPITVARRVAAIVLGARPDPFDAPLSVHPLAALRRRAVWALAICALLLAVVGWLVLVDVAPTWTIVVPVALVPVALWCAVVAFRALGHTIAGDFLVVRSGLWSRSTSVLQRSAVSTVVVRESLLQRRLGLRTVIAATSAGEGGYAAIDVSADEALELVSAAAPELLEPFVTRDRSSG